jgi:hypothetical protein
MMLCVPSLIPSAMAAGCLRMRRTRNNVSHNRLSVIGFMTRTLAGRWVRGRRLISFAQFRLLACFCALTPGVLANAKTREGRLVWLPTQPVLIA